MLSPLPFTQTTFTSVSTIPSSGTFAGLKARKPVEHAQIDNPVESLPSKYKKDLHLMNAKRIILHEQTSQHRHDRLWLYGPGALQRLSQSQQLFRSCLSACSQSRVCPQR